MKMKIYTFSYKNNCNKSLGKDIYLIFIRERNTVNCIILLIIIIANTFNSEYQTINNDAGPLILA